eukprot:2443095-Prymnesium_polylepis.2
MPSLIWPAPYAAAHCALDTAGTVTSMAASESVPPDEVVPQPATVSGVPAAVSGSSSVARELTAA